MRQALGLGALHLRQLTSFVWLLAANTDASARRPADARTFAERIVDATDRHDPDALDALAVCYAALGQFDAAIRTATEALSLLPMPGATAQTEDVRQRIELYRRREAVVLGR
jgi:tetratricopeptide (TPR) repeat protein